MTDPPRRSRLLYAALIAVTVAIGLASRKFSFLLPAILAKNAGDILYATMAFWLAGFLAPTLPTRRAAIYATLFCFAIEFSQIYQAPWINAVRHNRLGGLILGFGFHVTDLLCYLIGVLLGVGIERLLYKRPPGPQ